MTLQFSIIGYAIIALFYIISAAFLLALWIRRERFRWVKPVLAVLIPIVLVLPWAEEVWIARNFAKLCDESGVHVTRKVKADGYYDDTGGGPRKAGVIQNPQAIDSNEKSEFRFREFKIGYGKGEKVSHVEKNTDGNWHVTILERPSARYHFRYSNPSKEVPVGWKIQKVETQLFDSDHGEVIARDRIFLRFPNLIEWQWIRFFGTGMEICRGPLNDPMKQKRIGQLYKYALIPQK